MLYNIIYLFFFPRVDYNNTDQVIFVLRKSIYSVITIYITWRDTIQSFEMNKKDMRKKLIRIKKNYKCILVYSNTFSFLFFFHNNLRSCNRVNICAYYLKIRAKTIISYPRFINSLSIILCKRRRAFIRRITNEYTK